MLTATRTTIVLLLVFLAVIVGGIVLQVFLSRVEARWPGLVLPGLTVLYSVFMLLNVAQPADVDMGFVLSLLMTVFVLNIPTLVLLAVYFICRSKRKQDKLLEKMNIQDL